MTDNYLVIRLCSTSAVDAIHSVFKGAGTCAGAVGAQRAGQTISSGKAHIDVVLSKAIFGGVQVRLKQPAVFQGHRAQ